MAVRRKPAEKTASPLADAQVEPDAEPGYHTRSLVRALSILEAFSPERRHLAVKDLHLLLDLPKPTVSRLAAELERSGYLMRRDQTYMLGPKLFELGSLFARQDGLVEVGRPLLEKLSADLRQTACLGVLMVPDIIHVLVVPSASPVQYVTKVGSLAPAHSTGLGKVLLAALPDEAFEALVPKLSLKRYTPNTIVDVKLLRKEIAIIRSRGYAIDDEETAQGLKCVAVAVRLPPIVSAAISLSGPAAEFSEQAISTFAEKLMRTAADLHAVFASTADYASASDPAAYALNSRPVN
jgi:DNA-binding IclR family transcriptional regulator